MLLNELQPQRLTPLKVVCRDWREVQWLGVTIALVEGLGSDPSTYRAAQDHLPLQSQWL